MFDHTYTRFLLALYIWKINIGYIEGCVHMHCTSLAYYINEPSCKANMNEVKSSGMSRCAGITVPEVSKDHNVFFSQVLRKQYPSKCQELQSQ